MATMTHESISDDSARFYEVARSLLSEYTDKLNRVRIEAKEISAPVTQTTPAKLVPSTDPWAAMKQEQSQLFWQLSNYFNAIEPAMRRFARQVSQRIEHSRLDDASQLELMIRLADFEANIERTSQELIVRQNAVHSQ